VNEPRILVAWCRDCSHWEPASALGKRCSSIYCARKLVKRRAYLCGDDCEEDWASFTRADLAAHRSENHGVAA